MLKELSKLKIVMFSDLSRSFKRGKILFTNSLGDFVPRSLPQAEKSSINFQCESIKSGASLTLKGGERTKYLG